MIPRYAPTYTYSDLLNSLRESSRDDLSDSLRSKLASIYNVQHVFLLASARVALYILLKAHNRPSGVAMPAYNCIVVPEAVNHAGYAPVFIDIDSRSLNMSADALSKSLTDEITVVLITHIFGIPSNISAILNVLQKHKILIVEDAAPALGAEFRGQLVGSFSDAAIISFQATKVISGENGGALLTNNTDLALKVEKLLKELNDTETGWGTFAKAVARKTATNPQIYQATQLGYRILKDEQMYETVAPQAEIPSSYLKQSSHFTNALILRQLDRLEWNLRRRRKIAQIYQNELSNLPGLMLPLIPDECSPAWIQFPIITENKGAFYKHMQRNSIDVTWTYRYSCADSFGHEDFPYAHQAARKVIGLPTYPSLSDEQAHYICKVASRYREVV